MILFIDFLPGNRSIFILWESFEKPGNMKIGFHIPDAISPAQAGFNNDKRVLGLAVYSVELTGN